MIFMKGRTKVLIVLLILSVYGACIVSTKGKLPNQTATIIDVENDKIFSLAVNEQVSLGQPIPLDYPRWNVEGKNATKFNDGKTLIISSVINYTKKFVFNATLNGLHLSFSVFPYFHAIISSRPDISIDFFVGTLELNSTLKDELRTKHKNIVADENFIWVNCSSINGEFFDKHRDHLVTINVGEILLKIGLINRPFSALAIKVKYIGFKPELDNICRVEIKSLYLLKKLPYYAIVNEGKSCPLLDGTTAYIIKRDGNFIRVASDYPYLQRAYIKYSINASSNALYTIFLVSKKSEEVVASRSNFLFSHSSRLDEIGTHIDWRQLVLLNPNFDPIGGLYSVMGDGDYAIIFAPVNRSKLESVKLYKVEFTFSKAQYTEFILPTLSEQTLLAATLFILITAGILPTSLLLALIYTHGKRSLKNNKKSVTRILIAGFAIRLILAPLTAYTNDLQIFAQLGALYFGSGILGAQWVSLPGFVYIQIATYFPYALLRAAGFQDFQFLALSIFAIEAFFAKIPSILGDLGTVFYLRKMSQKYMPEKEALITGLYMLNPLTIYISGILGQFDPIFLFTIILSIYYLTAKYDKVKATIFSSLALIINPIGAATFIPLLAKVKNKENLFAAVKVLLLAFSIISALMLPFFFEPKSPVLLTSYERFLTGIPGEAFYSKQFNFYLYGIIISSSVGYGLTFRFMLELLGHELGPLFYPLGTLAAFFALTVFFIYQMYRTKKVNAHETLLIGTFMLCTAIIFQLTFPTIYDQFVIWIAGLLLVAYLLSKGKIFVTIFTIISITTGCIYVAVWRNYVQLISGVERVSLGNPYLSNIMSASIGVLYSATLIVVLIITLKLWLQKPREQQ